MIEILFRAKSIIADSPNDLGYWREGNLVTRELFFETGNAMEHHIIPISDHMSFELDVDTEVWPQTLGQFIGLIDKNGKKIFTGDIVRFHGGYLEGNWIGEVAYDEPCALPILKGFMPCRSDSRYPSPFEVQISSRDKSTFEVIGNRWDNPEYLGEDVYERLLV